MPVCKWNEQSLMGFDRHLGRCHCPHYGSAARLKVVRGARLFLTYLRDARIITLPSVEPPVQEPALLSVFCQWQRQQRGTGAVTLPTDSSHARELRLRLG